MLNDVAVRRKKHGTVDEMCIIHVSQELRDLPFLSFLATQPVRCFCGIQGLSCCSKQNYKTQQLWTWGCFVAQQSVAMRFPVSLRNAQYNYLIERDCAVDIFPLNKQGCLTFLSLLTREEDGYGGLHWDLCEIWMQRAARCVLITSVVRQWN